MWCGILIFSTLPAVFRYMLTPSIKTNWQFNSWAVTDLENPKTLNRNLLIYPQSIDIFFGKSWLSSTSKQKDGGPLFSQSTQWKRSWIVLHLAHHGINKTKQPGQERPGQVYKISCVQMHSSYCAIKAGRKVQNTIQASLLRFRLGKFVALIINDWCCWDLVDRYNSILNFCRVFRHFSACTMVCIVHWLAELSLA